MGQFSWLDCITGEQILDDVVDDVFVLVPKEFGGGHIFEKEYDGYGHFGGRDVFALVAQWNVPERCCFCNDEVDRHYRIDIACYDKDNAALRYPIKITHIPDAVYEECGPSKSDPNQGWSIGDESDW